MSPALARIWLNHLRDAREVTTEPSSLPETRAGKIASRIRAAVELEAMHAKARELARAMLAEDGTGCAVGLLQELVTSS